MYIVFRIVTSKLPYSYLPPEASLDPGAGELGSAEVGDLRLRGPQVGHVGHRPGPCPVVHCSVLASPPSLVF